MRPGLLLAVPLLAAAALTGACGGSARASSSASTTTSPAGPGNFAAARARFTSCLESHGIPASEATQRLGFRGAAGPGGAGTNGTAAGDGTGSSPSSTPPTTTAAYGAAFAACRGDLPPGSGRGGFADSAAGRVYLQCLQLHGVTVPTTTPGSTGPPGASPGAGFGGLASDPNFQAARAACAALAPNRTGGTASTSSTTASRAA